MLSTQANIFTAYKERTMLMFKSIATKTLPLIAITLLLMCSGCTDDSSYRDIRTQEDAQNTLIRVLPTPTDLNFSLDRYNLIKRAYWTNGEFEKAKAVPCYYEVEDERIDVEVPIGTIQLISKAGTTLATYSIQGKPTSLTSYLTPDSEYFGRSSGYNEWLADIDGTYGDNSAGIFFFTTDNEYIEYTGDYIFSLTERGQQT